MNEENVTQTQSDTENETDSPCKKRGGVRKRRDPKIKVSKRDRAKFKALRPDVNLKNRTDEIADLASYAGQLSEEEKEWLNAFSNEYICSNFNHSGPKLHTTAQEKKICYDRNNARNRCIQTRKTIMNDLISFEELREIEILQNMVEEDDDIKFIEIAGEIKTLNKPTDEDNID